MRGFTLTEILVSFTVLVLAMTSALVLYDGAQRSFKKSENSIDQQQVVRIAFDLMASEIRMAGYNTNPDGDPARPDEQIEAATETAIVIRADLDAGRPEATNPELALEAAGVFAKVSTGNDEIVAFALSNPRSRDTLIYFADVSGRTRDGTVEQVTIPGISRTHDSPPYTLYRITLSEDGGVVKTPIAGNIRSLRFEYYDQAGIRLAPPGGAETLADKGVRSRIRRIRIEIEGLTRDPDPTWTDPDDTHFYTYNRRKFKLSGDVTPRNLGRKGLMDLSSSLSFPAPDVTPVLVPGHCRGLLVRWPSRPDDHWSYVVSFEDSDGRVGEYPSSGTSVYLNDLNHDRPHEVRLRSRDPFGNLSDLTDAVSIRTTNLEPPEEVQNLAVSVDPEGRVELVWDRVQDNAAGIPGDPLSPRLRDFRRYQIQRRPVDVADWETIDYTTGVSHVDLTAESCKAYDYRVLAQDRCNNPSGGGAVLEAMTVSNVPPQPPANLEAFIYGPDVRLTWQPVTRNVENGLIQVSTYGIYRLIWRSGGVPEDFGLYSLIAEVPADAEPLMYLDTAVSIPAGESAFYRVVASDGCGNDSMPSAGATAEQCSFTGRIVFVTPTDGADAPGITTLRLDVLEGAEDYVRAEIRFKDLVTLMTDPVIDCPAPSICDESLGPDWVSWTTQWNNWASHPHEIAATVHTAAGCSVTRSILVGPGIP